MQDPRNTLAHAPMHRKQILAVVVATALNAMDGFDVLSISFAAPGIASDWSISRAALGLVLSMELIGMGIGALILGTLADRVGRRPTTLLCLGIMSSGMALASLTTGVTQLSLCRLFTGLGIGGMLATTNAIVAETANARRRNLAVAAMTAGFPLGAVVGGSIASMLLGYTGRWQAVFQFGALATAMFIPLVLAFVPETLPFLMHRRPQRALSLINALLTSFGHPILSELPVQPEEHWHRTAGSLAQIKQGGLGVSTSLLIGSYFGHMMSFYFLVKWIPKIVVDLGFDPANAGAVLVWTNVGGATGALAVSLLSQRIGIRPLVIVAMVFGAVSIFSFGQALTTLTQLSIVGCIGGFFTNGATGGLYAIIAQSYPAALRAGGTGLVIGVGRGGAALGPIFAGLLFAGGWQLPAVAGTLACGTLFAAIALATLRYRENVAA